MRIAYIINQFPKASETFISREVHGMIELGYEIYPFSIRNLSQNEYLKLDKFTKDLVDKTHYIGKFASFKFIAEAILRLVLVKSSSNKLANLLHFDWRSLMLISRSLYIAQLVKKLNIQQIHAHWPYSSKVAALTSWLSKLPYSVSVHAHEVAHENEHFPYIFDSLSFASFCNEAAMVKLLDELPLEVHPKAHLVYHGVNISHFPLLPITSLTPDQDLHILSAGRFTTSKGFDRLIRACSRARKAGIGVKLTILGSSQSTLQSDLMELAKQLDFQDHLILPGWVPFNQVSEYMQRTHLFALLANTNFHDGLPNVVLEAMASGRPVILSPLPAASEAITNGKEGFVLDHPEDYDGFLKAVNLLNSDPNLLVEMGKAARGRMERDFDENIHLHRLAALFHKK